MNQRIWKWSLAAGLALLLALPAIAHSQRPAPQPGSELAAPGPPPGPAPGAFAQRRGFGQRDLRDGRAGGAQAPGRFARGRGAGAPSFHRRVPGRRAGPRGAARRSGGGIGRRGGAPNLAVRALRAVDRIGLTAEQTENIEQALRTRREASINRRAAVQIAELELRDLLAADSPDIAAVEAQLRELSEQRIVEQIEALRLDAAVGEMLTAEQLDELDDPPRRRPRGRRPRPADAR